MEKSGKRLLDRRAADGQHGVADDVPAVWQPGYAIGRALIKMMTEMLAAELGARAFG